VRADVECLRRRFLERVRSAEHPALLALRLWREAPPGACLVCMRDRGERWDERDGRPVYACKREGAACQHAWKKLRRRIVERTQEAKASLIAELEADAATVLQLPAPRRQPQQTRRAAA
jgi:hypothetical protein